MGSLVEYRKLGQLKSRLESMGYTLPLVAESAPLVEKLLRDLITVSTDYRAMKSQVEQQNNDVTTMQRQMQPLQKENGRLLKENNLLHLELIKQNEQFEEKERKHNAIVKKLEAQLSEMQFIAMQHLNDKRAMEKDSDAMKLRINELLLKTNVSVSAGRPVIESSRPLEPAKANPSIQLPTPPPVDRNIKDLIAASDMEISRLKEQLIRITTENDTNMHQISTLRKQVESREGEINRLSGFLENGRDPQQIQREYLDEANQRLIDQLNQQVEFLTGELQRLEKESTRGQDLEEALKKAHLENKRLLEAVEEVNGKNRSLYEEVRSLQDTSARTAAVRAMESDQTRHSIEKALTGLSIQQAAAQASQADGEATRRYVEGLMEELERVRNSVSSLQNDKATLTSMAAKAEADRQSLAEQVSRMSAEKGELQKRLDVSLADLRIATDKCSSLEREVAQLRSHLAHQRVEGDTDASVIRSLRSDLEAAEALSRQQSANIAAITADNDRMSGDVRRLQEQLAVCEIERTDLEHECSASTHKLRVIQGTSAHLEKERDALKQDLESQMNNLRLEKEKSVTLSLELHKANSDLARLRLELKRVEGQLQQATTDKDQLSQVLFETQRERDDLASLIKTFESQLLGIQATIKALSADRDNINVMYEEVCADVRAAKDGERHASAQCDKLLSTIKRMEMEINAAQMEVKRLSGEVEHARTRASTAERDATEQARRAEAAESKAMRLQSNLSETEQSQAADTDQLRKAIDEKLAADGRISTVERQMEECRRELADRANHIEQLKALVMQMDRAREELLSKLQVAQAQTKEYQSRLDAVHEDKRKGLDDAASRANEIARLQSVLAGVDSERDALQAEVDAAAEREVAILESHDHLKEEVRALKDACETAHRQLDVMNEQANKREAEVRTLRGQVNQLGREREGLEAESRIKSADIKAVADDLGNVTRENQVLSRELSSIAGEREHLGAALQEAMTKVVFLEQVIKAKDQEKEDLLATYRSLNDENSRIVAAQHHASDDVHTLRVQVGALEKELKRMSVHIQDIEEENRRYVIDLQTFERQTDQLSRSLAKAQAHIERSTGEKEALHNTASSAQQALHGVESTREGLMREVGNLRSELLHMRSEYDEARAEREASLAVLNAERIRSKELEGLLANLRLSDARLRSMHAEGNNVQSALESKIRTLEQENVALRSNRPIRTSRASNGTIDGASDALKQKIAELERTVAHQHKVIQEMDTRQTRLVAEMSARSVQTTPQSVDRPVPSSS